MSDFNVRADSVNVEQIMDQIRARIRDKRGVDYTEEQIRELASVKLEKFLDPRGIRSGLLEQFRQSQPPPAPVTVPLYPFEDTTLFDSHRGIVRLFRRLFRPLLKLFFNSNALAQSLHQQTIINRQTVDRLDALEASVRQRGDLYYELLHNLVLELTRATIEVKNVTMRVESISSRLEFNERRARALESVVVYKTSEPERDARPAAPAPPSAPPQRSAYAPRENQRYTPPPATPRPQAPPPPPVPIPAAATAVSIGSAAPAVQPSAQGDAAVPGEGPGQRSRRRRRRRGRRGGASASAVMGAPGEPANAAAPPSGNATSTSAPAPASATESAAEPATSIVTATESNASAAGAHPPQAREMQPGPTGQASGSSTPRAESREEGPPAPAEPPSFEPHPSSDAHDDDDQ